MYKIYVKSYVLTLPRAHGNNSELWNITKIVPYDGLVPARVETLRDESIGDSYPSARNVLQ